MLTGEIRNQIDRVWDAFWSGGISNPLEVIEQITYLLFIKRLDDLHILVFPFLRTLGGDQSTYAHHMKDARFTIPIPSLLAKVVDMLDKVPMEDRDTKGDLYEYTSGTTIITTLIIIRSAITATACIIIVITSRTYSRQALNLLP